MELLDLSSVDLIAKGNSYISSRQNAAKQLLDNVFKFRLGRGFYGECLGTRVDGNSELSDEIAKQLSVKSAAAGLRTKVIMVVIILSGLTKKLCSLFHSSMPK
ncbi:uncharacterized protein LOC132177935 [Corylus avellana]|uniref:uncharacterized protein LOC132177935 n=1 Tax=Corylus avellana TaxID=13451 RepID=UPI00286AB044|nr:uncharacterized protein LOC132177935 [Corylus avellana]